MHIVINRRELLKQMQIADIAILNDKAGYTKSGMVLEAKEDKLIFKTNGDGLHIISPTSCRVIEDGIVNIRHNLIEEFLKQLDDEEVEIRVNDTTLSIITQTNIETNFSILENININIPEINVDMEYSFNRLELLNKLEKVKFAASTQPDLENLNCVRMEIEKENLKLIATDSYRLIYFEEKYDNNTSNMIVNIPLRTIDGLIKVIKLTEEDNISLKSEGVRIQFKMGDILIYSKLVETQFPVYEPIFSALNGSKEILIEMNSFKNLLKRLQVFEKEEKGNSVIFSMKNNVMTASINNSNSKFKEQINILYDDSEEIKVSLSVKFILEYINTIKNEKELIIKMDNNDRRPVVMFVKGEEKIYYFIMPTRI